ncbi:MAG TPA: hypothetical protein VGD38_04770 [Pyrinomonadaceae bacterium]
MNSVSTTNLLQTISQAANDDDQFARLRNLVFDYFADEETYLFESESVRDVFGVLLPYLHFEEAFGDEQRAERMKRLEKALRAELTPEMAVLGLEYERIAELDRKKQSGVISDFTFQQQLRKISASKINWAKVLALYASHADLAS